MKLLRGTGAALVLLRLGQAFNSSSPCAVPFGEGGYPGLRAHRFWHGQHLPSQEKALIHPSTPSSSKTL